MEIAAARLRVAGRSANPSYVDRRFRRDRRQAYRKTPARTIIGSCSRFFRGSGEIDLVKDFPQANLDAQRRQR